MPVNDGTLAGWPYVNHAMGVRGTQTERGSGRQTIVYPRRKFTYLVEFAINPRALDPTRMETNLLNFLRNGRLYATLKSIDHPKPTMVTEKLRSYNKHVLVPTKMEYQPASMSFHDDNSSIAAALWKEYRSFYQYEGRIGANSIRANAPSRSQIDEFRLGNDLVGENVRSDMQNKPSLGMRMRENDGRHFFDAIIIYDLGADPDSVNVYSFLYPVVTSLDHEGLDYEDRTGQVSMTMTFDYEGYSQLVGVNNAQFHEVMDQFLGTRPLTTSNAVQGHARMTPPEASAYPTSMFTNGALGAQTNVVSTPSSTLPSTISDGVSLNTIPSIPTVTTTPLGAQPDEGLIEVLRKTLDRI